MLGKISRAASFLFLIFNLRFQHGPHHVVDFVFSNPLIRPLQMPSELHRFAEIIASIRPKKVLEIGTFQGGTLCMFARLSAPRATIISIDLPGGKFGGGQTRLRSLLYHMFGKLLQRMHLIRGDSHSEEVSAKVRDITQGLDALFIDGDHTYEGVKHDFLSYSPLVRPGGIIAFHDIAEQTPEIGCEVSRFWNAVKTSYRHEEIIENQNVGWGIGVLYI
ncbi:MAG: class I SAM-dependent methyltransferase [Alphaproteobacteria bacterium]